MTDLFTPISRDERQEQCVKAWLKAKGRASIEACTGFGKTRIGLMCINRLRKKYPTISVLIIVPTDNLQKQWLGNLDEWGLGINSDVQVINSAVKKQQQVDFLILDEVHRYSSDMFGQILTTVKYKLILGLTATYERLDGKHVLMDKYAPVVDSVPIELAKVSGWVAEHTEYQVILEPEDLNVYSEINKEFTQYFEFFQYDFGLVQSMLGPKGYIAKNNYRNELCKNMSSDDPRRKEILKQITVNAVGFSRTMNARKKYIYNHPLKIEIAKEIMKWRSDKRIITFSANVKMAESIGGGEVYTGKVSKKRSSTLIEDFSSGKFNVLHSVKKLDEGADVKGVSVAIILGLDSSKTRSIQRAGRTIRKEGDKYAEIFNLVIADTVECDWFARSHAGKKFVTIDVPNLMKLLRGEPWEPYKKKVKQFTYRF